MSDSGKCRQGGQGMGRDGREATILNRAAKEGLTEKVTSEERPEGGKGVSHTDNWEKSSPGMGEQQVQRS